MLSKAQVKIIKSLHLKKYRQNSGLFIAEGAKIVEELLRSEKIQVESLYVLPEFKEQFLSFPTNLTEVSPKELRLISELRNPPGILAICQIPSQKEVPDPKGKVSLMLDAIRDPGNLGTILRIADWFGIGQIFCSEDCVDAYNSKVVQASMGSIARVTTWYGDLTKILQQNTRPETYATLLEGEPVTSVSTIKEGIILIGSESHGISHEIISLSDRKITIPRIGDAESLNAAVATGIICGQLLL